MTVTAPTSVAASDIKTAITAVVEGDVLDRERAAAVMGAIMEGEATGAQIAALVTALRLRGETVDEIAGFASAMRDNAIHVQLPDNLEYVVDTCGTGGDHSNSFNISTTASFIIAAAGVNIAKHGNRSITSQCGSADLLEGLGIAIELAPEQVAECIRQVGIGFMYAPAFHPAMRYVGPTRREIGIRTIFNILGPLTNPAGARHQLIGVGQNGIAPKLAQALAALGCQHAVLVRADEGLDEIGIAGGTLVTDYDARSGETREYRVTPEDFGLERGAPDDLRGGDVADNVRITMAILEGESGPRRDVVLMNAGAAIYAADRVSSIGDGIELARAVLDDGSALARVERLAEVSQALTADPVGVDA
ncbi:MAG TPA: anthranilate phosphoribosyltransferase [Thermomicrobiales bacterium]|jgi:anthranilate phosphoribosyltransferase|nr:anthranilate phosphoribosyltransferase [Thermomicrobiales bacterium]